MQTILGSGGAIGQDLAKALTQYTTDIRLVSRKPEKVNETDTLLPLDMLSPGAVEQAVEGSEVVYVTIGFPYSIKFWRQNWVPFMQSVVDACANHGAKLVFFDNMYLYDKDHLGNMTEETPIHPPSKKGQVRAEIHRLIMGAAESGKKKALIARAADFYGPGIANSMLIETVFKPLSEGKKANWMGKDNYPHSFTYTPDAGKATAMLGNTEDAYNQVWHMPTAPNPLTGKEWVEAIAKTLEVPPKHREVPKWMLQIMGLFNPLMREIVEMQYQNDRPYVFNSEKFEKRFGFTPTSYEVGIKATAAPIKKV